MKLQLIALAMLTFSGFTHASDCSPTAKKAVRAIVDLNARTLIQKERVRSTKLSSSTRIDQTFEVITQSGDSSYEWSVITTHNCQISRVEFVTGL